MLQPCCVGVAEYHGVPLVLLLQLQCCTDLDMALQGVNSVAGWRTEAELQQKLFRLGKFRWFGVTDVVCKQPVFLSQRFAMVQVRSAQGHVVTVGSAVALLLQRVQLLQQPPVAFRITDSMLNSNPAVGCFYRSP